MHDENRSLHQTSRKCGESGQLRMSCLQPTKAVYFLHSFLSFISGDGVRYTVNGVVCSSSWYAGLITCLFPAVFVHFSRRCLWQMYRQFARNTGDNSCQRSWIMRSGANSLAMLLSCYICSVNNS